MEPAYILDASDRHASGLHFRDGLWYTGGMGGHFKAWKKDTLVETFKGHTGSVNKIGFIGDTMVTSGSDKQTLIWDGPDVIDTWKGFPGSAVRDEVLLHKERSDKVFLRSLDGATREAATGFSRVMGVWAIPGGWAVSGLDDVLEVRDSNLELIAKLPGHGHAVTSVSHNDDWILTSGNNGVLHLWDHQFEPVRDIDLDATGYIFSAIGKHIAASADGALRVLDLDGNELDRHAPGIKGIYGSCWGDGLANAAADGKVRVYDV